MLPAAASYDLVIVGASFAGLVAARTAAMRGLKVAVLDAKHGAGHRVATTGILVKEAVEEIDIPHALTRRVYGVRLYAPNLKHVDLFAPGYFFLTTDTANLLRWLADEAQRAGVHLLWKTRFEGAAREGDVFRLSNLNICARYILGADGSRSAVARHFGLGRNSRFLTGVEYEYEGLCDIDPRFLHCFLNSEIAAGYLAWVASAPTVVQAGLAVGPGRRPDVGKFLNYTDRIFQFGKARLVGRRAGRIPCGGLVQPWAGNGVMLVGDAAGMVSPATGGGIRLAFHFGRRAGQVIADHLLHMGPAPDVALAPELPSFLLKRAMRFGLDQQLPNSLISAALGTSAMRTFAQQVFFHKRGAKGVTFSEFEERLARLSTSIASGAEAAVSQGK
ncbi:NAD(P)/FAD-dependent oxidoreductase [Filomicrobium sp.]|uniref:NAD(P)/FAD-dependent oxidoreductase n=1 Tax=Filomicrobium sp. TaxID=2024831 RepID=UPI00258AE701|nr:NAD(P)/FAD-dependent oxidoreductase [Filomicrobium sp.]MCV0368726.1 NAD(P)/FAD-dependent oxidoreductase [Filomicrobium sp.]